MLEFQKKTLENLWEDKANTEIVKYVDYTDGSISATSVLLDCNPENVSKQFVQVSSGSPNHKFYRIYAPSGTKAILVTTLPPSGNKVYKQFLFR